MCKMVVHVMYVPFVEVHVMYVPFIEEYIDIIFVPNIPSETELPIEKRLCNRVRLET